MYKSVFVRKKASFEIETQPNHDELAKELDAQNEEQSAHNTSAPPQSVKDVVTKAGTVVKPFRKSGTRSDPHLLPTKQKTSLKPISFEERLKDTKYAKFLKDDPKPQDDDDPDFKPRRPKGPRKSVGLRPPGQGQGNDQ